jgi:hypothetical protein
MFDDKKITRFNLTNKYLMKGKYEMNYNCLRNNIDNNLSIFNEKLRQPKAQDGPPAV